MGVAGWKVEGLPPHHRVRGARGAPGLHDEQGCDHAAGSDEGIPLGPTPPSLLDAEVEDLLPYLECSQISSLPDSSVDITENKVDSSILNLTDSLFIDCIKIHELLFHQAVQNNDQDLLLEEIQHYSDIDLSINSADSKGR